MLDLYLTSAVKEVTWTFKDSYLNSVKLSLVELHNRN